jgi:hypothetical protein
MIWKDGEIDQGWIWKYGLDISPNPKDILMKNS